ncbi:MAG TPA: hypothetical protein VEG38_12585 [Acidimicrobiia bacterium]|nr:hypothetical protein [Acidimicrobiia bacterium]
MIEPEAVIDPEAAPAAPRPRRHRRAIVAGVTLLAVVAGGIAVASGDGPDAKPLALMAGNGAGGGAETMSADAGTSAPLAPALGSPASRSSMPYGWGLTFEVVGQLPALPDHAPSWDVNTPDLDRAAMARIAEALGVTGTPVQRDGGWFVEGGDWTLNAYGGDAMGKGGAWYLNLYRGRSDGRALAAGDDTPAASAISRAEAERRVSDLLTRMGAPRASWKVETTDTEIGVGWACPAPGFNPEELRKLEAEKLAQLERENAASAVSGSGTGRAPGARSSGSSGATPAREPAADAPIAPCAPPPPPVKGFNVALYPLLDGRRADWPVWNVTLRSDGRLENLYGSWVNFERGGDYKLRGVDAALKDLQSPPGVAYATDSPAASIEPATGLPADADAGGGGGAGIGSTEPAHSAGATEPAHPAGAAEPASGRRPLRGDVASAPAVDLPADTPVCPMPMPMPVEDGKATTSVAAGCAAPAPQVVKITGVELGLIQTSVFENGQIRLALVPSYRFTGHYENGGAWETSVLGLHPSAIAPPPDWPVDNGVRAGGATTGSAADATTGSGGGTTADGDTTGSPGTGVGKATPPAPAAEPAIPLDAN